MTEAERKSYFELKTDTPYLALTGELWGVSYENFKEDWPRHDGTALHIHIYAQMSECVFSLNAIINGRISFLLFHSYARCPHTQTCIQTDTAYAV